jgi:hypothetical protein
VTRQAAKKTKRRNRTQILRVSAYIGSDEVRS